MPRPTTKSRQELRSRFVRNAIPTEMDFADLINAGLNQADDGLLKLPDQPLGLVRQKADQPVLRFFADPAAEAAAWQVQMGAGDKPDFRLAGPDGRPALVLDGATGQLGIGTASGSAGGKVTVQGPFPSPRDPDSGLTNGGLVALKGLSPQLDFIDTEHGDWAIHVNEGRLYFIRQPWEHEDLVLDGRGKVGIGTKSPDGKLNILELTGTPASAMAGTLMLDHFNAGGASSIVFRSRVNYTSDFGFIEFRDKNPDLTGEDPLVKLESALMTIGIQNDAQDHIALMPSGNVGIGTTTPRFKLDVNGSTRLGGFTTEEKDEWPLLVWCREPDKGWDEGLIKHGKQRGFFGRSGYGVHLDPTRSFGLFSTGWNTLFEVEGGTGNASLKGGLTIGGQITCAHPRVQAVASDHIRIATDAWTDMPGMVVDLLVDGPVLVLFKTGGVQAYPGRNVRGKFRLLIDGAQKAFTLHEFHNEGWELRDVSLFWLDTLGPGSHNFRIQWRAELGTLGVCWYNDTRSLIVIRL